MNDARLWCGGVMLMYIRPLDSPCETASRAFDASVLCANIWPEVRAYGSTASRHMQVGSPAITTENVHVHVHVH